MTARLYQCIECPVRFRAVNPGPTRGRCPKCAAYHRGAAEARDKARRRALRRAVQDETEGRAERMEERAALVSELVRGKR